MATAGDKLSLITVVIAAGDRRCDSSSTQKNIARMRGDAIYLYLTYNLQFFVVPVDVSACRRSRSRRDEIPLKKMDDRRTRLDPQPISRRWKVGRGSMRMGRGSHSAGRGLYFGWSQAVMLRNH